MPNTTAGHTWIDGETVTYAKLRAAALPVVSITPEDVTSIAEDLSASAAGINYLLNSDFRTWPQTSISLPATWTLTASGWYAKGTYSPSASTGMTVQRSTDAVHDHVIYCASITGEPNGTIATIGQRFTSSVAAAWLEDGATLQIEVENKTGGNQTATLVWETCDVLDDFSATTQQTTVSLGTVLANERKVLTVTLDLTSFKTATRRGGILSVQLPGLNSGSKEWRVYYSRLEPGQVASPRRIERDAIEESTTTTSELQNYFANPAFSRWNIGATFAVAVEDADNYFCNRWGITPSDGGTTGVVTRVASAPDTRSKYALQIAGNVAITSTTDLHQFIPSNVAAHLLADTLNVSFWVFNGTGATITPTLRIDTCSSSNNTTLTNRLSQAMQACTNNTWTRVTLSITPASYTNWSNGAKISLRFAAGTLDSGTKSIRVTQAQMVRGTAAATFREPLDFAEPIASTARTARDLTITRPTTTSVLVNCVEAVCVADDGSAVVARNIVTTITDAGGSAFSNGQWYLIKVCADEAGNGTAVAYLETTGGLTTPSGHRWKSGVIGAFYFTSSAVSEFQQEGHMVDTLANSFTITTLAADTYQLVPVFAGLEFSCPALAIAIRGSVGGNAAAGQRIGLAKSTTGLGAQNFLGANAATNVDSFQGAAFGFSASIATRVLYIKSAAALGTVLRLTTTGYDLP